MVPMEIDGAFNWEYTFVYVHLYKVVSGTVGTIHTLALTDKDIQTCNT